MTPEEWAKWFDEQEPFIKQVTVAVLLCLIEGGFTEHEAALSAYQIIEESKMDTIVELMEGVIGIDDNGKVH